MESQPVKVTDSSTSNQNSSKQIFNKHLNVEFLDKTYGNNLLFCSKMFGIFLATTGKDMRELEAAIRSDDFETTKGIAHKIKNNFTWVGLPDLSKKMYDIETLAMAKSTEMIQHFTEVKSIHGKAIGHVEAQYKELQKAIS